MKWLPTSWQIALIAIVCVAGLAYLTGRGHGVTAERGRAALAENVRMAAVSQAVGETVARANALAADVERLRARPAQIREVIKEVRVESDADCSSLPPGWLRVWNATGADDYPDAGAAGVGAGAGARRDVALRSAPGGAAALRV